jgi:hypothetical protein
MKFITTTLVSACLAVAAGSAVAANDMHKDGSMTAQECKAWMETSKPTPKDAEAARKAKACDDVINNQAATKGSMKGDAVKDKDLVKEEPAAVKK